MRKAKMMQACGPWNAHGWQHALARSVAAGALVLGLAFGSFGTMMPQVAFADTDAGARTQVQDADASVLVGDGTVRLTKLGSSSVLVELMRADAQSAADVGLEARAADGQALPGATFAFTPEAEALPTHHVIANGNEVRVVVADGQQALSPDSAVFALGTLSLPADAAKVVVASLALMDQAGQETEPELGASAELVISAGSGDQPPNGDGSGNQDGNGNATNNGSGNTTNVIPPDGTLNGDGTGGVDGTGGAQNTTNPPGGTGGINGGTGTNGGSGGSGGTSNGKDLPQTGDGQLVDASALLLIGGAASLLAGAIIFFRRHNPRKDS